MKSISIHVSVAALCCLLSAPVYAQTASANQSSTQPTTPAPGAEAQVQHMVTARAVLVRTLDADKDASGSTFEAKLSKTIHLDNGAEIPKGSTLMGQVVDDDMNVGGNSKLALRFTKAQLKDGSFVPVKVTIVGLYPPALETEIDPDDSVNTEWNPSYLVMDQVGALKGVDLHSRIGGRNSGTLVSSTKSEMKLGMGSQFALVIGPVQPTAADTTTQTNR